MLKIRIVLRVFLAFAACSLAGAASTHGSVASGYAGDAACRSCHQEKVDAYLRTAHHLTSQPADQNSILGKFTEGENILKTSNPELFYRMEANPRGQFQTAVMGIPPDTTSRTERFDLVIGSGGKGQTYLYWKGEELFQLPVTYWTELGQWVNSPGYRDGFPDFSRRVLPRCLDCHASYFESLAPPLNHYRNPGFELGISCEKCHGDGRDHVAGRTSKQPATSAHLIVNPAQLTRDRQIDLCALCHAGIGELTAKPFTYVPGEPLDKYLALPQLDPSANIDVHGSQVELLKRSRCYQSSAAMTCSTCHNVHATQHDLAAFSERCLSCHKAESCGVYPKMGGKIVSNCIDCHMPDQQTNLIVSDSNGRKVRPKVRNHWIKIYPEN